MEEIKGNSRVKEFPGAVAELTSEKACKVARRPTSAARFQLLALSLIWSVVSGFSPLVGGLAMASAQLFASYAKLLQQGGV